MVMNSLVSRGCAACSGAAPAPAGSGEWYCFVVPSLKGLKDFGGRFPALTCGASLWRVASATVVFRQSIPTQKDAGAASAGYLGKRSRLESGGGKCPPDSRRDGGATRNRPMRLFPFFPAIGARSFPSGADGVIGHLTVGSEFVDQ